MKLKPIYYVLALVFIAALSPLKAQKIRIETQNSQKFIIHKVQASETLWRITQLYDVEQNDLLKYNPGIDKVLKLGSEIRVPYTEATVDPKMTYKSPNQSDISNQTIKHKVSKGEWLSKIARKYEVSVEDIKKWNDLSAEEIKPGQELIVGIGRSKSTNKNSNKNTASNSLNKNPDKSNPSKGKNLQSAAPDTPIIHTVVKGEWLSKIARNYQVELADIRKWNGLTEDKVTPGEKLKIYAPVPINNNPNNMNGQNNAVNNDPFNNLANNNVPNRGGNAIGEPIMYYVNDGDNIYRIQNKYNVRKTEIRFWNDMPATSNKLVAGQTLKIYPPRQLTHIVQPQQSLRDIAQIYGVNYRQIEIWNNFMRDQGDIKKKVGHGLTIYQPTGPKPTAAFEQAAKVTPGQNTQLSNNNNNTSNQSNYRNNNTNTTSNQGNYRNNNTNTGNQYNYGNNNNQGNNGYNANSNNFGNQANYIMHKVTQNELLYDIAKKYNVKIRDIRTWNNLESYNLTPGQSLKIYTSEGNVNSSYNSTNNNSQGNYNNNNSNASNNNNQAVNRGGQNTQGNANSNNPYLTSNTYTTSSTSDDPFDQLNNSTMTPSNNNNNSSNYNSNTDRYLNNNNNSSNYNSNTDRYLNNNNNNSSNYNSNTDRYLNNNSSNNYNRGAVRTINDKGLAGVTSIPSAKPMVALHRDAPIGTEIIIRNPVNGKNVTVEVAANIPAAKVRAGVIIEVSTAVFARLGANPTQLLPVEISYPSNR